MTLKQLREAARKTQEQVATDLGISVSYYCLLENGKRRLSLDNAAKIAQSLGVTLATVFQAYRASRSLPQSQPQGGREQIAAR